MTTQSGGTKLKKSMLIDAEMAWLKSTNAFGN